jgi:hypothetical protein
MSQKIRMTLLIDERSHPELYADLAGIDGDRNRTERVRYLAGIGLVLSANQVAARPVSRTQLPVTATESALPVDDAKPRVRHSRAHQSGDETTHRSEPPQKQNIQAPQALGALPVHGEGAGRAGREDAVAGGDAGVPESGVAPQETPAQKAARLMAKAGLFGSASPPREPET